MANEVIWTSTATLGSLFGVIWGDERTAPALNLGVFGNVVRRGSEDVCDIGPGRGVASFQRMDIGVEHRVPGYVARVFQLKDQIDAFCLFFLKKRDPPIDELERSGH